MTPDPVTTAEHADGKRLRARLGGVEIPQMRGDCLAVFLCSHFDNPAQEADGDTGWTPDAESGCDALLNAIHAHYAPIFAAHDALALRCKAETAARLAMQEALTKIFGFPVHDDGKYVFVDGPGDAEMGGFVDGYIAAREQAEAALAEVMREPSDKRIEAGARAICRQMGWNPDGNDSDCRPRNESSAGWSNWLYFKTEARRCYEAMIPSAAAEVK